MTTENKMERCGKKCTGLRAGEEMNRATWSRKIIGHTGDHISREKPGGKDDEEINLVCDL